MQTLSQRRAKKALELLAEIEETGESRKDFSQFCKSFPTMVLQNGLGQALAFIKSKKDTKYEHMYKTLNAWLSELNLIQVDTFQEINKIDSRKYTIIQAESLKFLEWIKRYENAGIF